MRLEPGKLYETIKWIEMFPENYYKYPNIPPISLPRGSILLCIKIRNHPDPPPKNSYLAKYKSKTEVVFLYGTNLMVGNRKFDVKPHLFIKKTL